MNKQRRFIRFIIEGELEVIDDIQTKVFLSDFGTDADGNLGMPVWDEEFERVIPPQARALSQLLGQVVEGNRDALGFRLLSSSCLGRPVEGDEHPKVTLPAIPARRDDGSYPDDVG